MRTELKKEQYAIGSFQITVPNGGIIEVDVYTQTDGGIYVTQYYINGGIGGGGDIGIGGGIGAGQTCFYCNGKLIGCVNCGTGGSPSGNCITGQVTCE